MPVNTLMGCLWQCNVMWCKQQKGMQWMTAEWKTTIGKWYHVYDRYLSWCRCRVKAGCLSSPNIAKLLETSMRMSLMSQTYFCAGMMSCQVCDERSTRNEVKLTGVWRRDGRMHGRTGIIEGMRGRSYIVKVMDHGMEKTFIIQPAHLKRLK